MADDTSHRLVSLFPVGTHNDDTGGTHTIDKTGELHKALTATNLAFPFVQDGRADIQWVVFCNHRRKF